MALLALTLQLGLSFGHVHAAHASAPALTTTADHPETGDHDDDYCATCAILALLTGAQTATAATIAPQAAVTTAEINATPEAARAMSPRPAFQSRAPPLS
ncbi:MAG: DUF2946 domain-containing protein [Hyphomicrobiales bacterium]|nr:DUF2946 domain-containing protein [Alphaproteobacteria bacterium]